MRTGRGSLFRVAMLCRRPAFAAAFLLLGALACGGDSGPEAAAPQGAEKALYVQSPPAACTWPARSAPTAKPGEPLIISEGTPPCRIYFRETGIVLRGDSASGAPDPGPYVARDSRGRFISSIAGDHARLAVWNPDGSFDRTIGREGFGPGEFPRSQFAPVIFVDGADRIYVRSGGGVWSILEPTFEHVGRMGIPSIQSRGSNAVFRDGTIIASAGAGGERVDYFQRYTPNGSGPTGFAEIPLDRRAAGSERTTVPADDSTFWASPDAGSDAGYLLEHWSITGTRLAALRRDVSWLPRPKTQSAPPAPTDPPRPFVNLRSVGPDGLLLVYATVNNDTWRPLAAGEERPRVSTRRNVHIDVIAPREGTVVASEVVNISALGEGTIPFEFFPRTNLGYRIDDSGDLPVVRIVEYGLRPR